MSQANSNLTFTGIRKPREDASRVIANGIRTKSLLVEDNIKIEENAEVMGIECGAAADRHHTIVCGGSYGRISF